MRMSFLGTLLLALTSYAVIVLMGVILMRTTELEKVRAAPVPEQEVEEVRIPLPAGPRKFQQPQG